MTDSTEVARRDESQAPATNKPIECVEDIFHSASFKRQVAQALPEHIGVDRMMRTVLTEVRKTPDLAKCTPASFMGALLSAAQAGLRPGMFGEGWILPRWSGKLQALEAQFQPGYMGLTQLAYRSGEVASVTMGVVYAADHFHYQLGSDPRIDHTPNLDVERGEDDIRLFYATITLTNGGKLMEVMSKAEIDDVRDRFGPTNRSGKLVGPWVSDYVPMGKKTVLIRALKLAPKDPEKDKRLQAALQAETDVLFADRTAAATVGGPALPVAERVAERLGLGSNGDDNDDGPGEGAPSASEPIEGEVARSSRTRAHRLRQPAGEADTEPPGMDAGSTRRSARASGVQGGERRGHHPAADAHAAGRLAQARGGA